MKHLTPGFAFDLPINPEDLPMMSQQQSSQVQNSQTSSSLQHAYNFIINLKQLFHSNSASSVQQLQTVYDQTFNQLCTQIFAKSELPEPHEIEQNYDSLEVDYLTQIFYKELCYRHVYARLNIDQLSHIRVQAWINYKELFEVILDEGKSLKLPVSWIWDILDEFIYQFQTTCQWRAKIDETNPSNEQFKQLQTIINQPEQEYPNLNDVQQILINLVEKSKVLGKGADGTFMLEDFSPNTTALHYFGYFALINLLRLNILTGDFQVAMNVIQPIDFSKLTLYSKVYACYFTLFYYAGFAYMQAKRYREAAKLFEAILIFFNKYKSYYQKYKHYFFTFKLSSFQFKTISKQADKTLYLLALVSILCPVQIEEGIAKSMKDILYSEKDKQDKYAKLQKYDTSMFHEIFNFGAPKLINPITDKNHFITFTIDEQNFIADLKQEMLQSYQQSQQFNSLRSVLKLYSKISIAKAAKIMKMELEPFKKLLNDFKLNNSVKIQQNPFEQTVVKKLLGNSTVIDFAIDKEIIIVNEQTEDEINYEQIFTQVNNEIEEMNRELENLLFLKA